MAGQRGVCLLLSRFVILSAAKDPRFVILSAAKDPPRVWGSSSHTRRVLRFAQDDIAPTLR